MFINPQEVRSDLLRAQAVFFLEALDVEQNVRTLVEFT